MLHRIRWAVAAILVAAVAGLAPAQELPASLKMLPASTSSYTSSLRNKEQLDLVLKSNAWAKLKELSFVQMGLKQIEQQWANPEPQMAQFKALLEMAENKELLDVLGDAVSHEVFLAGGEGWVEFSQLYGSINSANQMAPFQALAQGQVDPQAQQRAQTRAMLLALMKDLKALKAPELVVGFKVTDAKKAKTQLQRLEKLLDQMAQQQPAFREAYKPVKFGDDAFLRITVTGSMFPLEQIPWGELEEKPGEFKPLADKLKELKLTVTLGVKDGYLLVSMGETDQVIPNLAKGPRLADVPELKPLAKFAARKLTGISYTSKALVASAGDGTASWTAMLTSARDAVKHLELPKEQKERLEKDLDDLVKNAQKQKPEFGALVAFSFLTERGSEAYTYNYTKQPGLDGGKPLTILEHLGGSPLLAVAGRSKYDPADYKAFSQFVKTFWGHVDEIALTKLAGEEKVQYEKATKLLIPQVKRLDEITGTLLLPSLADGQSAFVLDGKWTSKQWHKAAPPTEKAMPMLEMGIVVGVSDAAKLVQAMGEYRKWVNETWAKVRELAPPGSDVPAFEIPAPKSEKSKSGTLYFYPIPAEAGLDEQVQPAGGVSEANKVAALALSKGHTERLLSKTPLAVKGGPLADPKKPLAGAVVFDWAGLVDLATPWVVDLAAGRAIKEQLAIDEKQAAEVMKQVRTVLDVLKVYRGSTSATYVEDGVVVTHSESVYVDVGK